MRKRIVAVALCALALLNCRGGPEAPALDGTSALSGGARVIDGDTLDVGGTRVRLFGIDAPESRQRCTGRDGTDWSCGTAATAALRDRIGGGAVLCSTRDMDRYGRAVAICRQDGEDLNAWMVRQGWAVAYRSYSDAYAGAEAEARQERRGLWSGTFQSPGAWRRAHPRS